MFLAFEQLAEGFAGSTCRVRYLCNKDQNISGPVTANLASSEIDMYSPH